MGSEALGRVWLAGVTTLAEMQRLVAEKVAIVRLGAWITDRGWNEANPASVAALPAAADLDTVAPANSVYL